MSDFFYFLWVALEALAHIALIPAAVVGLIICAIVLVVKSTTKPSAEVVLTDHNAQTLESLHRLSRRHKSRP